MKYILVLLADWANGLFAVLIASYVYHIEPQWWFFLVGILLSHVPDLDGLPELLQRGKVAASAEHVKDHRSGLHYPLLLLGLGALAWFVVGYWGLILFCNLALHLSNDFYGTGWGIKLLWPFTSRQYKLCGRRVNRLKFLLQQSGDWDKLSESERRFRCIVSWSPEELPGYMHRWGIDDWIDPYYLRCTWISTLEYVLFIVACIGTLLTVVR